ncbi:MAG TPA: glycosyltransferase family 2 protein [bacterium]|nr:glycosyltransferase family 2 protein [bacterium]
MTLALTTILVILLIHLAVVLFNALSAPLVKNGPLPTASPRVSVLVPARNEEKKIHTCLAALQKQKYAKLEITVLDDQSTDRTAEIVRQFAAVDSRFHLIEGKPLPEGWTGKNWACHQLSQQSDTDILIFTDADNWISADAVAKTVGWMQKYGLALFSCFPQQITRTWGEKLVVPMFDLFVYGFLPLQLTYRTRFASLAAANGQWMAFDRRSYLALGGHHRVRHHIVEDVEFSRLMKKLGCKIITASGRDAVFGRMYTNWPEVWQGFSKNAFGLVAFKTIPFIALLVMLTAIYILPYVGLILWPYNQLLLAAVGMNLAIRAITAIKFKQPIFCSIVLHPLAVALTLAIGVNSLVKHRQGEIDWKGRAVPMQ